MLKITGVNELGVHFTLEMGGDDTTRFKDILQSIEQVMPKTTHKPVEIPKPPERRIIAKTKRMVIGGYVPESRYIELLRERGYSEKAIEWHLWEMRVTRAMLLDLWLYRETSYSKTE